MYKQLKKLFSESLFYSLGNLIRRSASIVTMPVFTRFMSVEEYGILSLVRTFREFLRMIFELGTSASSTRFYYECNNKEEKITLFSTLFIFVFCFSLGAAILLLCFGERWWNFFVKDIPFYPYVALAIIPPVMSAPGIMTRTLFRTHGQAKQFVKLNVLFTVLTMMLSIPAVAIFDMGALGPLSSAVVIQVIFFFIYLSYLWEYLSFTFVFKILKKCLTFGLPGMTVPLGNWVLKNINQFVLQHYWSLSSVAVYSVAYSVSSIFFELIIAAIHWAVEPFYYQIRKEEAEEKVKEIFAYVGMLNTTLILFLGLSVIYLGEELLLIFASSKYADSKPLITILAISAIFQFLFFIPSRVLYVKKKTMYLPPLLFTAIAANVILCFALIPQYGVTGAAWATAIAFFIRTFVTLIISQRIYYIPYDYYRIGKAFLAFLATLLVEDFLPDGPFYLLIPLKLAMLTLYPVLLYFFGYFQEQEIKRIRQILMYRQ